MGTIKLIGLHSPYPQAGKSTVAGILMRERRYSVRSFAEPIKRMAADLLATAGFTSKEIGYYMAEGKEETIPYPIGVSFRYLCQTLGTEWGRNLVSTNLWVDVAFQPEFPGRGVVFDDVRFPNEVEAIRAAGGRIWCVHRGSLESHGGHPSEGAIPLSDMDVFINNSGDLDHLTQLVLGSA